MLSYLVLLCEGTCWLAASHTTTEHTFARQMYVQNFWATGSQGVVTSGITRKHGRVQCTGQYLLTLILFHSTSLLFDLYFKRRTLYNVKCFEPTVLQLWYTKQTSMGHKSLMYQGVRVSQLVQWWATGYAAGVQFLAKTRGFSLLYRVQTSSGVHPVSYSMVTEALSLAVKR